MGGGPISGSDAGGWGSGHAGRHHLSVQQLARMADETFAAEVRQHHAARWSRGRLLAHVKKHRRDFEEIIGRALTPSDLDELSRAVLWSWDRLFRGREVDGKVTYCFVSRWSTYKGILVVATRDGRIRTLIPMDLLDEWLQRHSYLVEVTDRAKRLGL